MNKQIESTESVAKSNVRFAVILGLIAVAIAMMPFFYLNSATL
jgi:hypothetical protein